MVNKKQTHTKYLLTCKNCGKKFFTQGEKDFYIKKGLNFPKRCKKCREKVKQKVYEPEKITDIPYDKIKFEDIDINKFNSEKSLYIIGNGFDIIHGVKSRYRNFYNFLSKKDRIGACYLELILGKDDIWSDFEDSLAYLNREIINGVDDALDNFEVFDEDDENFKYADYHLAVEQASYPVTFLTEELPVLFRKWVNKLTPIQGILPLRYILDINAKYINFNYTEFLESIYKINSDNIFYIHGCRKNKKCNLILGHGHNSDELFEEWNKTNKGVNQDNSPLNLAYFKDEDDENYNDYKNPLRYYAINEVQSNIEGYYDDSQKNTKEIIIQNDTYFYNLHNIEQIIVLGHSLSFVDYPYFEEIIENNSKQNYLKWLISYYNNDDLIRIIKFVDKMQIEAEQIKLFKIS